MTYLLSDSQLGDLRSLFRRLKESRNSFSTFDNISREAESVLKNIQTKKIKEEKNYDPALYWKSNEGYIRYADMTNAHIKNAVAKQLSKGEVTAPLLDEYFLRELDKETVEQTVNVQITARELRILLNTGFLEGYVPPRMTTKESLYTYRRFGL